MPHRHGEARSHPVQEQDARADRRLAMVVIDQTFTVAGEDLHVSFQLPVERKTPINLSCSMKVAEVEVASQQQ